MERLFHDLLEIITGSLHLGILVALLMFAAGVLAFFNPCMLGVVPLLAERAGKLKGGRAAIIGHVAVFSLGFLLSLALWTGVFMVFLEAARWWSGLWPKLLGVFYLFIALYLFGVRLPTEFLPQVTGFYRSRRAPHPFLLSALMGALLGLVPSPCTTTLVMAVTGMVVPNLGAAAGLLLVLLYGLGHALPLMLILVFASRFRIAGLRRFHGVFRMVVAVMLLLLAFWFLMYQPGVIVPGEIDMLH